MAANRFALLAARNFAKGIAVRASRDTMSTNQMMYSTWSGYLITRAMGVDAATAAIMNKAVVTSNDIRDVLYTLLRSGSVSEKRKKVVSMP